ncbi:hypothetical protein [Prosthecobacter sp.]|uniref:hypothetical protein n=1 Tax=Prosthecobacter sp. TaxID=1965333 RepID=UPI002ABAD3A1|nr:hypothetical protein [Prosthecobacter sp.]MDZ4403826.1 hypothetical protein [Prosthecobacter sp.]
MLTTSRNPGVVHAGYHTYKPFHGVLGFMMSCVASVIMLRVLLHLFKEEEISEQNMQIAAGLSVVGCLLFYLGTTWFFSFITGYSRKLSVSEGGIRYGVAYFSWPQVAVIGVCMKRGCFQVHVVLKRGWFANRRLVTDDGMSREMAEEFIAELRRQILPHFPHLVIARLPSLPQALAVTEPVGMSDAEPAPE